MSLKQKLLQIQQLGTFATFTPEQTFNAYAQLKRFLTIHTQDLSNSEYYNLIELDFHLSLLQCKDEEAKVCLDRLIDKFGEIDSSRIAVLKATYLQATKSNATAVEYLGLRNPNEVNSLKKRVALTKLTADSREYIKALNGVLDLSPCDVETWSELGDEYHNVGHLDKAIYAYEEVLLIQPFNYFALAKLGELYHALYLQGKEKNKDDLTKSVEYFGRSVELVANFVRGWSGVYFTTKKHSNFNELHELSKKRLNEIIQNEQNTKEELELAKRILEI